MSKIENIICIRVISEIFILSLCVLCGVTEHYIACSLLCFYFILSDCGWSEFFKKIDIYNKNRFN